MEDKTDEFYRNFYLEIFEICKEDRKKIRNYSKNVIKNDLLLALIEYQASLNHGIQK